MTTGRVPVGVIGAGNMGRNHVRVYDQLDGANLVEVVEPDPERAATVSEEYDVTVLDDVADLERAAAVSIATPNHLHRETAVSCIDAGLDVLVEKPLATTVEDAQAIVDVADEHDAVLQVGHIERFNPAVQTLERILQNEQLVALEAHRLGPFNEHLTEESVVYDLMIHDLDVILHLVDGAVTSLDAIGTTMRSNELDHAIAAFKFESGALGTATSSHVTHGKVRELHATTRNMFVELDYYQQDIVIQRHGTEEATDLMGESGYRTETIQESPFIQTREPLQEELEHFVECVQSRKTPAVDGYAGVEAVDLATSVVETIRGR